MRTSRSLTSPTKRFLLGALLLASTLSALAAEPAKYDFGSWEKGTSPQEIGARVAQHFVETPHLRQNHFIIYPEICAWYGALTFANVTKDKALVQKLVDRFEPFFAPDQAYRIPPINHVDNCVFGSVPLEIYIQTGKSSYRALGLNIADGQWDNPTPEGLTNETRLWIDDMFMITAVQVQAYRATGDTKYLDRTAKEMVYYLDKLQQPNGLFFHAPDAPFHWGRGNGWMAVGMTELLRSLPENHPAHARIMRGYKAMMETLLKNQDEKGMWHQLIDKPDAWAETSGTGMFTFAFITGVKNGWLDAATYGPAAKKAWLALITYINENADIREVCVGTNKKNDLQFYLDRPRAVGDMHGQAPVLWCATAFLR
ncbi:MAG TPA: glycoside hydrolase family 88 protein [Opitutaceae bacterium]|nr:glycoside hydrolase family 88 protein [Opitutaceae bacterium]